MKIDAKNKEGETLSSITINDIYIKQERWGILARAIWRLLEDLKGKEKTDQVVDVTIT